jgi:hypothetical protein
MRQLKQTGFGPLHVLLAVVIVGILAFTGYYVWQSKNEVEKTQASTINSANSTAKKPVQTKISVNTAAYKGKQVTSGQGAFSFMAPNGWALVSDTSLDYFFSKSAINYDATGTPTITEVSGSGHDGNDVFSIRAFNSASEYTFERSNPEELDLLNGAEVTRYTKQYASGDPMGISAAEGGEVSYAYEIKKDGHIILVNHFVDKGKVDQHVFVESLIKTITIR